MGLNKHIKIIIASVLFHVIIAACLIGIVTFHYSVESKVELQIFICFVLECVSVVLGMVFYMIIDTLNRD